MLRTLLSWSGGKDCSMALQTGREKDGMEIVGLLTTVTEGYDRVSMHGVRRSLLEMQAASIGLPLEQVSIPQNSTNEQYEARMRQTLAECIASRSVEGVIFGDLFLEDVREYRIKRLRELNLDAIFPLWKRDTGELSQAFISSGFRAIVCCVDTERLEASFCGEEFDDNLLARLPEGVDPCGENGEFHTFVYDGPIFHDRIRLERGEVVMKDRFCFCDLLPRGLR